MAGLRQPYLGIVTFDGTENRRWSRRDFARRVAFLPQMVRLEFPFTAEQVVFMGRTPYGGGWFESDEDHGAVAEAMETTDTVAFRTRDFERFPGRAAAGDFWRRRWRSVPKRCCWTSRPLFSI